MLLPQDDPLATVSEVDRQLVMQCFRENYRRCGTGDPSAETKSCGCTLAHGLVPHHSVVPDFVGTLRAWAAKRPTQEERGLVSRLSRFQRKKQQETAAVAAILAANGVCIREIKTKYAIKWCTAEEKAQKKQPFLKPNTIFGWVPKEGGGAEGDGVPGNGAAAAPLADGAAMGGDDAGGACVVGPPSATSTALSGDGGGGDGMATGVGGGEASGAVETLPMPQSTSASTPSPFRFSALASASAPLSHATDSAALPQLPAPARNAQSGSSDEAAREQLKAQDVAPKRTPKTDTANAGPERP